MASFPREAQLQLLGVAGSLCVPGLELMAPASHVVSALDPTGREGGGSGRFIRRHTEGCSAGSCSLGKILTELEIFKLEKEEDGAFVTRSTPTFSCCSSCP